MKLGLAAVLLMTAGGFGQTTTSKTIGMCLNTVTNVWATCTPMPKRHKRKPKPTIWPTIASAQIQLTEKQRNAFESNKWMKPCGADNHDDSCYVPDDPCDGLACTAPVEMLPKPDTKQELTFPGSTYSLIVNATAKCGWSWFTYDEKTKTCTTTISFAVHGQIVCTPLTLNDEGLPAMTCSYKPHDEQKGHP